VSLPQTVAAGLAATVRAGLPLTASISFPRLQHTVLFNPV